MRGDWTNGGYMFLETALIFFHTHRCSTKKCMEGRYECSVKKCERSRSRLCDKCWQKVLDTPPTMKNVRGMKKIGYDYILDFKDK